MVATLARIFGIFGGTACAPPCSAGPGPFPAGELLTAVTATSTGTGPRGLLRQSPDRWATPTWPTTAKADKRAITFSSSTLACFRLVPEHGYEDEDDHARACAPGAGSPAEPCAYPRPAGVPGC